MEAKSRRPENYPFKPRGSIEFVIETILSPPCHYDELLSREVMGMWSTSAWNNMGTSWDHVECIYYKRATRKEMFVRVEKLSNFIFRVKIKFNDSPIGRDLGSVRFMPNFAKLHAVVKVPPFNLRKTRSKTLANSVSDYKKTSFDVPDDIIKHKDDPQENSNPYSATLSLGIKLKKLKDKKEYYAPSMEFKMEKNEGLRKFIEMYKKRVDENPRKLEIQEFKKEEPVKSTTEYVNVDDDGFNPFLMDIE